MPGSISGFSPNLFPALPKLPPAAIGGAAAGVAPQVDFQQALLSAVQQVNTQQLQANSAIEASLIGDGDTQVEAMMAMKKAEMSFRTMLQVRNKLVDAYNEIKDMRF